MRGPPASVPCATMTSAPASSQRFQVLRMDRSARASTCNPLKLERVKWQATRRSRRASTRSNLSGKSGNAPETGRQCPEQPLRRGDIDKQTAVNDGESGSNLVAARTALLD
jgi:hypothetical protein